MFSKDDALVRTKRTWLLVASILMTIIGSAPAVGLDAGCAADTTEDPSVAADDPTASDDAEVDTTSEDLTAKPTFATVGPIVTANCGGCHAQFKTLAGIKADKTVMIAKITAGAMPKGNPTWKKTADGKKALK